MFDTRFRNFTSVALAASLLCPHAANAYQDAIENKGLGELRPAELSKGITSARNLKFRSFVLEPGGLVELHGHKDHPSLLHVIKGTLTHHPHGVVLRAGVGLAEDKNSNFLIENTGDEPAEFIWLPYESSSP